MLGIFRSISIVSLFAGLIIAANNYFIKNKSITESFLSGFHEIDSTGNAENNEHQKPVIGPGIYYVADTLSEPIDVYKDVLKKEQYEDGLAPMSKLDIKQIENGLGYSDLLYGQYTDEGGWVNMKDIVSESEMFPGNEYGKYQVKSTEINGINLYKDFFLKKKFRKKLKPMKEISIYKIRNDIGYFKDLYISDLGMISGWVELNKLKQIKSGF